MSAACGFTLGRSSTHLAAQLQSLDQKVSSGCRFWQEMLLWIPWTWHTCLWGHLSSCVQPDIGPQKPEHLF